MEIKISSKQILNVLLVISWILFVGICIDAGGFIVNTVLCLGHDSNLASHFWKGLNLSDLYQFDSGYFLVETSLMIIVALMKALLFYLIVKLLHNKKIDFSKPFNEEVSRFIYHISYLSLGLGFFSLWGSKYTKWLVSKGIVMPNIESLNFGGADVWLFMGITLLVISHIIKKGIEIQTENELTI